MGYNHVHTGDPMYHHVVEAILEDHSEMGGGRIRLRGEEGRDVLISLGSVRGWPLEVKDKEGRVLFTFPAEPTRTIPDPFGSPGETMEIGQRGEKPTTKPRDV